MICQLVFEIGKTRRPLFNFLLSMGLGATNPQIDNMGPNNANYSKRKDKKLILIPKLLSQKQ